MFTESRIGQQVAVYFHEQRVRIVTDRRFITCLLPNQIKSQLMESIATQALDSHSFGQLGGSLVRIADKKNPCRIDFLYFNQVFDLSYDGGCLAASGTAYDQTIILFRYDGTPLLFVQRIFQTMIEKEFVPIERILDNLLVMQSDELADIIEIMEKFYNDIRWLDTELFELWNERICFLVIIRVITGKFFFLRKGYITGGKTGL